VSSDADIGDDCTIDPEAVLAPPETSGDPPTLGDGATVRSGTVVYPDVIVGERLTTGHDVVVREHTEIGDDCTLGTKTVIDGHTVVGDRVSMQTGVYVPAYTEIHSDVFLGPNAVLTNDPYPIRSDADLAGPTLREGVSVGANATINPDVTVGERSFVAAGAVVIEDVPADRLAVGVPAETRPLPDHLQGVNDIR
jgi:acetyltransferase-like isoleucine patch superfamily enzyme